MMELEGRLADAAAAVAADTRPKSFEAAARRFTQALQTIPDYPAAEMSNEGFARVNALAEQVISEIEHRLERNIRDADRREALTQAIYDIRAALEEAFRWRRHYLKT